MASENVFLIHAFEMGIYITFVYDLLRIFRKVFPHDIFFISLEDILFWVYCATKVFLLMYHESNGKLRWFAILGAVCGMFLYKKVISNLFVNSMAKILGWIRELLLRPIRLLRNCICGFVRKQIKAGIVRKEKRKRRINHWKKKLTSLLKMHKIDS